MGIRREIEACRVVEGLEPKQEGPLGCKVGISNEVEASRAVEGSEPEKGGRATGWSTLGSVCLSDILKNCISQRILLGTVLRQAQDSALD